MLNFHIFGSNSLYMKLLKLAGMLFSCMLGMYGYSQEAVTSSGGNGSSGNGSVSYSIGQLVYSTAIGPRNSVTHGVQQPYEIQVTNIAENAPEINLQFSTYPNPTTDWLNLKIENYNGEPLTYSLIDMFGKEILQNEITGAETNISMSEYASATYFLKVLNNNTELKAFKILKNH